jgi:TonB family protein
MRTSRNVLLLAVVLLSACQTAPRFVQKGGFLEADGEKVTITTSRCFGYPPAAASDGRQGTARVRVAFDGQGNMVDSAIARSSGHADLDAAALAFVRCAKPMPDSRDAKAGAFNIEIPVTFFLRGGT